MNPFLALLAVLSGAGAAPPPPTGLTGAVSPLLPSLCRPSEDAGAGVVRCAALPGTDLFLRGPEEARDVAVGVPMDFLPPPPGARLGRSVAWRFLGDRPVAAILRYRFAEGADVLVVVKPPRDGKVGCAVGAVEDGADPAGTAADRAAAFADRRAPLFRCGEDRPSLDGPWSAAGRARMETWRGQEALRGG